MAATRVIQISNTGDGQNVFVTLDAAPAGALTFKASRLPGDPAAVAVTGINVGGNTYEVLVRTGAAHPASPVRLNYYLQAFDGATQLESYQLGTDLQRADETCEWIAQNDNTDWLDQCERAFLEVLVDNFAALNRGMELYLTSQNWPNGQQVFIQKIHAGVPAHEEGNKYPHVSLRTYTLKDDPYWANPRSDYLPLTTTITAYMVHQAEVNWEPLCRALGMAIFNVLNQNHYLEIRLDCGLIMSEVYALSGTSSEEWDEDARAWVSGFTLDVQSRLFTGREAL